MLEEEQQDRVEVIVLQQLDHLNQVVVVLLETETEAVTGSAELGNAASSLLRFLQSFALVTVIAAGQKQKEVVDELALLAKELPA